MYMIEIYLEKKLKKKLKSWKCVYFAVLSHPAQRERFYSKMCVFLESFVRVNDLVFVFLNGPPPPPCQNATGNNLANIWATGPHQPPGANRMEADEPRGRRVNPPV